MVSKLRIIWKQTVQGSEAEQRRLKHENLPLWLMQNNAYQAPTLFGEAYVQTADAGGYLTRMGAELPRFGRIDRNLGGYVHTGNNHWS